MLALDCQKHLVHVPFVSEPRMPATELIGILLAEFTAPLANGFIGHDHATLKQQLLDIAVTQAERKYSQTA